MSSPQVVVYTDIGMEPFSYALAFGRAAPVQVVFWGHPTTSGVPDAVDYYLLMDGAEPEVEAPQLRYSEQLVRLDGLGSWYRANESGQLRPGTPRHAYAAESAFLRAAPRNATLYAAPQHCLKFHPAFDAALVGILNGDPKAVLVLKDCSGQTDGPTVLDRLGPAVVGGVGGRVVVVPQIALEDYVRLYGGSHVALETFPFGGSITTLDAFEAATPVVAKRPASGAAARPALTIALYDIAGVDCCVADDVDGYVALAIHLANDQAARQRASEAIARGRSRLYENLDHVAEVAAFLDRALHLADRVASSR